MPVQFVGIFEFLKFRWQSETTVVEKFQTVSYEQE